VIALTYGLSIAAGMLSADDTAMRDIEDALQIIEGSGDDIPLGFARISAGVALVHRDSRPEQDRGLELLGQVRDMCLNGQFYLSVLAVADVWAAHARVRRGDRDGAMPVLRAAVKDLFSRGQFGYCDTATRVLVETLLDRASDADVAEAKAAIERLAAAPADEGLVIRDIWLLRLRALLARARADDPAYRDYRDRYRDMAKTLGFEGHIAWAKDMP
jgi:hypothetical protein